MRLRDYIYLSLCAVTMVFGTSSCFSGVESTPRIGLAEVKRNKAAKPTEESLYLSDVAPSAPSEWGSKGLRLHIDDRRISRLIAPGTVIPDSLAPRDVIFESASAAVSLMGEDATDIIFVDKNDGTRITLRMNVPYASLDTLRRLDVPFTIDLGLVEQTDSLLRGKTLYVTTDNWYDENGRAVNGLRHVGVKVDSVTVGTSIYPTAVFFSLIDAQQNALAGIAENERRMMLMSVGGVGASARNFAALFNFEAPRRRHPEIEDDVWNLIIQGKVRTGMTPTECRLALGSPSNTLRVPTRAGMRESWTYPDGVYLVFDDGYLWQFRL